MLSSAKPSSKVVAEDVDPLRILQGSSASATGTRDGALLRMSIR